MRWVLVILLLVNTFTHAQFSDEHLRTLARMDSIIKDGQNDTSICEAYVNWGELVYLTNPDTAVIIMALARELATLKLQESPAPELAYLLVRQAQMFPKLALQRMHFLRRNLRSDW